MEKCYVNYAKMNTNHTSYSSFAHPRAKQEKKKLATVLLHHFHRSRDYTECMQQAVKPLVSHRGELLSLKGF